MMSADDNFLVRWSRRKRRPIADAQEQVDRETDAVVFEVPGNSASTRELKSPFDPVSLPPMESIGPGSDVRAFLASGVPPDLARAALRRLWSSDPEIRDFVGLSENSWDFNAPGAMGGFGPMDNEQVRRGLVQLLGDLDIETVASPSTDKSDDPGAAEVETSPSNSVHEVAQGSIGTTTVGQKALNALGREAAQPANKSAS